MAGRKVQKHSFFIAPSLPFCCLFAARPQCPAGRRIAGATDNSVGHANLFKTATQLEVIEKAEGNSFARLVTGILRSFLERKLLQNHVQEGDVSPCQFRERSTFMYLRSKLLCLAAGAILASSAVAQNPPPTQSQPGQQPAPTTRNPEPGMVPTDTTQTMVDPLASDKKFVKEAAAGSRAEVELGKLAQEKASSEAVKEFAKRMVEDHSKASQELAQAAAKANIEVPSDTPRKVRKAQEKLSKLSGPEFDRAYAKFMFNDHKDDVKAFDKQSQAGKVPELKEFAANTLPTLLEHLKMAEQLDASTKGGEASAKK